MATATNESTNRLIDCAVTSFKSGALPLRHTRHLKLCLVILALRHATVLYADAIYGPWVLQRDGRALLFLMRRNVTNRPSCGPDHQPGVGGTEVTIRPRQKKPAAHHVIFRKGNESLRCCAPKICNSCNDVTPRPSQTGNTY
jgi:hypothetical protein